MQPERQSDEHVILCLNCGSSSLGFALIQLSGRKRPGSPRWRWRPARRTRSEPLPGSQYHRGVRPHPQQKTLHAESSPAPQRACTVRVIPTNEDLMIARHTRTLLFPTADPR